MKILLVKQWFQPEQFYKGIPFAKALMERQEVQPWAAGNGRTESYFEQALACQTHQDVQSVWRQ